MNLRNAKNLIEYYTAALALKPEANKFRDYDMRHAKLSERERLVQLVDDIRLAAAHTVVQSDHPRGPDLIAWGEQLAERLESGESLDGIL